MNFSKIPSNFFAFTFVVFFILVFCSNVSKNSSFSKSISYYLPEKIAPIWTLFSPTPTLSSWNIEIQCDQGSWEPLLKDKHGINYIIFEKERFSYEYFSIFFAMDFEKFKKDKCQKCNYNEKEFVNNERYLFYDNIFTNYCHLNHPHATFYRTKLSNFTPPVFSARKTNYHKLAVYVFPKIIIE